MPLVVTGELEHFKDALMGLQKEFRSDHISGYEDGLNHFLEQPGLVSTMPLTGLFDDNNEYNIYSLFFEHVGNPFDKKFKLKY